MRLLGELIADTSTEPYLANFGSPVAAVRGVTVSVFVAPGDPLLIRSGPTGAEVSDFQGRPFIAGGAAYQFGGPVQGPTVSIDWQGIASDRRATFRFWDTPVPSFGVVPLARWNESGIPAASFSTPFPLDDPGAWLRNLLVVVKADQNGQAWWTPTIGTISATVRSSLGSLGDPDAVTILGFPFPRSDLQLEIENLGGAAMEVDFEVWALFGQT